MVEEVLRPREENESSRYYFPLGVGAVAVLAGAYLSVLFHIMDVVEQAEIFLAVVVAALLLAVVAQALTNRIAVVLGIVLLVGGLVAYVMLLPPAYQAELSPDRFIHDMSVLLSGFSVLRMVKVGEWILAITAGPTFLVAYFALRRLWVASVTVGGLTLGFFVLTGDAGTVATMLGVLGATAAVGFGTLEKHGSSLAHGEIVGGLLALMVIGAGTVTAVPGSTSPFAPSATPSVSGDIIDTGDRVEVGGSITLSPEVYFVVTAPRESYWRVSAYDRFTGTSWLRTDGDADPVAMSGPPDPTRDLPHRFTAKRTLGVIPAAASPRSVSGIDAEITAFGDLKGDAISANETYTVRSEEPILRANRLQQAGTEYPDVIEDRYLQLPSSTPGRVHDLSANVTAGANTQYEKALAVQAWLERNKAYSLSVPEPRGQIVDTFLFEMEEGYCTYYASSMVVMLRSQGVPARFVTGYTPGQQVDDNSWVVRGLDSHAWVEVYFPDVGWVRFDPTPGDDRRSVEQARIEASGQEVGPIEADDGIYEPERLPPSDSRLPNVDSLEEKLAENETDVESESTPDFLRSNETLTGFETGGTQGPRLPPPERLAMWGVVFVGGLLGLRRLGVTTGIYRMLWVRMDPRGSPGERTEGAFARVEYALAQQTRPRGPSETIRAYVEDVSDDERIREVARLAERARYGNVSSPTGADRANQLAGEIVDDLGVGWRFRGGDSV